MPERVIGMMNEAYFVNRKELLAWLNDFFKFGYDRIEQTCSGAAACQIMDCLYPGVVPLGKVNFEAKFDYEYIKNYKILQGIFAKLNIDKIIDVNKLIKGKYQDNLEFLQWMKRYFDTTFQGNEYDAIGRRKAAIKEYKSQNSKGTQSSTLNLNSTTTRKPLNPNNTLLNSSTLSNMTTNSKISVRNNVTTTRGTKDNNSKTKLLAAQIASLQLKIENIERERDFYFKKLRDIEIYTQDVEDNPNTSTQHLAFVRDIQKILYATDDDFGVDEDMTDSNKENIQQEENSSDVEM